MPDCRVCFAPIIWSTTAAGERVPLDDHEQRDYGPKRYRIVRDGNPPEIAPVPEESTARTFVDHRHLCRQPRVI